MKWPGAKEKQTKAKKDESFDNELLEVDFLCQLAYMASIATSGIPRSQLFYRASQLPYSATRFFRRVDFVAKMFNHDYTSACRIVGDKCKEPAIKSFLLRLSGALASGEDVTEFLSRESAILSESYRNTYERKLDLLKKWADGYVAMMLTPALVAVMGVVTMMLGVVSMGFISSMIVLSIFAAIVGTWFLYRTAPREVKNHSLPVRSKEQDFVRNLSRLLIPACIVFSIFLLVMQIKLGLVLIVASAFLFPVGIVAMSDDKKVTRRDSDIPGFLRAVGGTMQAIGVTAAEAISRLDFRSLGILKDDVSLLHTRLVDGINAYSCWREFVQETGSELINRSVTTFWDGITLGGEPQQVGNEASAFALRISLLRAQRSQISSGFLWITLAMHGALTSLVIFVYSIFLVFSNLVRDLMPTDEAMSSLASSLSSFGLFAVTDKAMNELHFFILMIVFILTIANAISVYSVSGGHWTKIYFYLAMTTVISGVVMSIVPVFVDVLFGQIG